MANETTATVVANLGHGTKTESIFHSVGAPRSSIARFCRMVEVDQGYATEGVTLLGARISASSYSEAGAANANTALPTPSQVTLTPASYVCTMAPTTQAFNRADPNLVDLVELCLDEVVYPLETLVAYDSTIGLVTSRFQLASNRVGTSGAALTPSTVMNSYKQLCTQLNQTDVDAILWLDLKGWNDLLLYGLTTASTIYASDVGANQLFLDLLDAQGISADGYKTSWGRIHIFVEPKPGSLYATGGDTIASMFIPDIGGLNGSPLPAGVASRLNSLAASLPGGFPIAPALGVGYRAKPAAAQALSGMGSSPFNREHIGISGLPVQTMARAYAGQGLVIVDGWVEVVTAEINDNSYVGVRYVS